MSEISANVAFDNAARAYELETKRLEVLSEAQERAMKTAALEQKVAEQHLQNARLKTSLVEYQASLRRFRATLAEKRREADRIRRLCESLSLLRNADRAPGIVRQNGWSAFSVLLNQSRGSLILDWSKTAVDSAACENRDHWVFKSIGGRDTSHLKLPSIKTLLDLILFESGAGANNVIVRWGTYPYLQTIGAFVSLDDAYSSSGRIRGVDRATSQR